MPLCAHRLRKSGVKTRRTERGVRNVQRWMHQEATATPLAPPSSRENPDPPPPLPRKLIKLKSWKKPELLAERAAGL